MNKVALIRVPNETGEAYFWFDLNLQLNLSSFWFDLDV